MKKAANLAAGLAAFDHRRAAAPVAPAEAAKPKTGKPPSRVGTVQIAAFFPEEVRAQLKMLAAEQRRDVQTCQLVIYSTS
jgi:hypothetical protein